jgi:hypothetical protein
MLRRRLRTSVALLALALPLAACSAAEEVADRAGGAATSAAVDVAEREAREALCPLVEDRQVSEQDRERIGAAVDVARAAGVDSPLLDDAEDLLGTDGTPPESAVARLADDCAPTP